MVLEPPSSDLDQIIPNATEEKLKAISNDVENNLQSLVSKHVSLLEKEVLTPEEIVNILEDFDDFIVNSSDLVTYGSLSFSANSNSPKNQLARMLAGNVQLSMQKNLIPFQQKINHTISKNPDMLDNPKILDYRHYLEKEHVLFAHQLDIPREKLILEKNHTGINALLELRSRYMSKTILSIQINGESKQIPFAQAGELANYDPDPDVRSTIWTAMGAAIQKDSELYGTVMRSLATDWITTCKLRSYKDPKAHSFKANDVHPSAVLKLMETMQN
jgi:oligoendopeptidase F